MRILGVGDWCDLGSLYLRLIEEGHQLRVVISEVRAQGILAGFLQRLPTLEQGLAWISSQRDESLIIFEDAKQGSLHDQLRADGFRVIGCGAYGTRLEGDRAFAQGELRSLGHAVARTEAFDSYEQAIAFLRNHGGRWVYKYNGDRFPSTHTYIGQLPDAQDLISVLAGHGRRWHWPDKPSFILMECKAGVEIGVGAWFNGSEFLDGAHCIDFEHKHFFPGDLGELTGEMGTLVRYRGGERLFSELLLPLEPRLRASGYHGWININTIINQAGVWPLEFTCRFGYPGFAILEALQLDAWGDLLWRVATGDSKTLHTRDEWSLGIVLTMPPFPHLTSEGVCEDLPVHFRRPITPEQARHLHYNEVALDGEQLVSRGVLGNLMVVTGIGREVQLAQRDALELARQVVAPNLRYRTDIGERFRDGDEHRLLTWGYLDPV